MNKILIAAAVFAVLGGGTYVYQTSSPADEKKSAVTADQLSWEFTNRGEDTETSAPRTQVTLHVATKAYDLGTYTGSCFDMKGSSWSLSENEVAGAICWWAGGGKEIGVFKENGGLVVKVGDLDEGSEETPGFRGNFKTKISL